MPIRKAHKRKIKTKFGTKTIRVKRSIVKKPKKRRRSH